MPAGWRSAGGAYRLQYSHPLCENSVAMVVAVCMGPVLVINGEFIIFISLFYLYLWTTAVCISSSIKNGAHSLLIMTFKYSDIFLTCLFFSAATLKVNETVDTVRKLCLNPSSYVTHEWPGTAVIGRSNANAELL